MPKFAARIFETHCLLVSFEADDVEQAIRFVEDRRPAEVASHFPDQSFYTPTQLRYELKEILEVESCP